MTATPIRSYRVTPTLYVGDIPMCGGIRVTTVEGATALILAGQMAVLPHGHWATAHEVLCALGLDEATIYDRLVFAQTARIPATA